MRSRWARSQRGGTHPRTPGSARTSTRAVSTRRAGVRHLDGNGPYDSVSCQRPAAPDAAHDRSRRSDRPCEWRPSPACGRRSSPTARLVSRGCPPRRSPQCWITLHTVEFHLRNLFDEGGCHTARSTGATRARFVPLQPTFARSRAHAAGAIPRAPSHGAASERPHDAMMRRCSSSGPRARTATVRFRATHPTR